MSTYNCTCPTCDRVFEYHSPIPTNCPKCQELETALNDYSLSDFDLLDDGFFDRFGKDLIFESTKEVTLVPADEITVDLMGKLMKMGNFENEVDLLRDAVIDLYTKVFLKQTSEECIDCGAIVYGSVRCNNCWNSRFGE